MKRLLIALLVLAALAAFVVSTTFTCCAPPAERPGTAEGPRSAAGAFADSLDGAPDPFRLPAYPGAGVVRTGDLERIASGQAWTASFETADAPRQVLAYYRETMTDAGWRREERLEGEPLNTETFLSGDCPFVAVRVSARRASEAATLVELRTQREFCH